MSPLELLLYSLALLPAAVVIALLVNLVAANLIETYRTAKQWPKGRLVRKARR